MIKNININGTEIEYTLEYKKVKNINLRIKPDCTVWVSANKNVSQKKIEEFVASKAEFVLKALEKYRSRACAANNVYRSHEQLVDTVMELCQRVYPYYESRGVRPPQIKFRKMVSCWGNCRPVKGVVTFSTNLIYAPPECVEYVVWHEFTHFLQANHSKLFYKELEKVCPDWKACRRKLREINIR